MSSMGSVGGMTGGAFFSPTNALIGGLKPQRKGKKAKAKAGAKDRKTTKKAGRSR